MFSYMTYGLHLSSELSLPELVETEITTKPDITVRMARANEHPDHYKTREAFTVKTEAGDFIIIDAHEIVIEANPSADAALIRLCLLGATMAALLRLRGQMVLHASGVVIDGGVVAFLGESGWGKSTLAEAFYAQGYTFVADDIIAISVSEQALTVTPGYPQTKLWPDAVDSMGHLAALPELYHNAHKRAHRLTTGFLQAPLPLKRLYILGTTDAASVRVVSLSPTQAFLEIVRCSRAMLIQNKPDMDRLHFYQCLNIVNRIPIALLERERSLLKLSELIHVIEHDIFHESKTVA
ncbi:MAG: serine kinase [Anaerolineae bacterium]|nr:serine kinase [Anaerolineae bacterium]